MFLRADVREQKEDQRLGRSQPHPSVLPPDSDLQE
jgi:hypothetical protein